MIEPESKRRARLATALGALNNRRVRAVGHLLTGTSATVVLSLLSITFAARALGPTQYGVLALILTLGQACERLFSFQSWQPLIRYGATLDPARDRDDLRSLFKFGLMLDAMGSVTAWAVASLLAVASHFLFGIPWATVEVALVFLVSLLFNMNGTATAAFRLSGRFRMVAYLQVAVAIVRLGATLFAFATGAGLIGFVIVWGTTQALGALLNIVFAMYLQASIGVTKVLTASLSGMGRRFPNVWGFTWGANISLTIWSSAQQVDTLIVGWLADPAAAGMFHIAKRVSRVVQQVGSHVEAVVYPDLSRLWAEGKKSAFVRLVIETEAILALFGATCFVVALLLSRMVLEATAGPSFGAAAPLLSIQILAVGLTISGAASRAGLLAMGRQPAVLRTVLAAAAAFYCSVVPLIEIFGAMGANIAHVLFGAIWLSGLGWSLREGLRSSRPGAAIKEAADGGRSGRTARSSSVAPDH
jgi:O-antigen/teichoic acid export membrane protein